MSVRVESLLQLVLIKQKLTEAAYQQLLYAKEQFVQSKLKHDQLLIYRKDYLQQLEILGNEGSSVGRLRNRIDFINHLDTALTQLNAHLALLAKARSKAEWEYKLAKRSEEAVNMLIEKAKRNEQLKIQRTEQKESDEYAQKQWYSKKMNDDANSISE